MAFMPGQGPQPTVEEYLTRIVPGQLASAPASASAGPALTAEESRRLEQRRREADAQARLALDRFLPAMAAAGHPGAEPVYARREYLNVFNRVKHFANVGYARTSHRDAAAFEAWPVFVREHLGDGHHMPSSWRMQVMLRTDGRWVEAPLPHTVDEAVKWLYIARTAPTSWAPRPHKHLVDDAPPTDRERLAAGGALAALARRHGVELA